MPVLNHGCTLMYTDSEWDEWVKLGAWCGMREMSEVGYMVAVLQGYIRKAEQEAGCHRKR